MLQLTVDQSVCLGVEPHLGLMTRYLLLFDSYGLVCICCWSLPAQSFSGPSPLVLATIFYYLRLETSLFVASYDSQGHSGGSPCILFYICLAYRIGSIKSNSSFLRCHETDISVMQETSVYVA
jgi:hypothetical protein